MLRSVLQFVAKVRWLTAAILLIFGLIYLNSAVFNFWAADVPPRLYPEQYRAIGSKHLGISVFLIILAVIIPILFRKKNNSQ